MGLKSFRTALLLGAAALGMEAASATLLPAHAQEATRTYAIEPQELDDALREFGRQTGRDILFAPDAVAGKRSPGVEGQMTERQALEALVAGTGLRFEQTASNGYAVLDPNSPTRLGDARRVAPSEAWVEDEEIVVIGTNIRGAHPASSPLEVYTAEDIARTGATTTEQFIGKLPQNLGTRTEFAAGATSNPNRESVTSIDLRGLGVGTTLTLLNGRRMGLANFAQAADVAMIPVSAIDQVQVLTDGASAIYGSDAIGGVVNFVLRDDFEGAETRASYGGVSEGGLRQGGFTQTFGSAWESGHGLVSLDAFAASALEAKDRSYASGSFVGGRGLLTPITRRYSALATGAQRLSNELTIDATLAASRREVKNVYFTSTSFPDGQPYRSETDQVFANIGANYDLSDRLNASLALTYSDTQVGSVTLPFPGSPTTPFVFDTNHSALNLTAMLDGSLLSLPAGDLKFAIGGDVLEENYEGSSSSTGFIASNRPIARRTLSAFGEILLPLVSESQGIPLVNRLEATLAARYTSYEDTSDPSLDVDFGERLSPKVGLVWDITEQVRLRGTYGESFRAPALSQIDPSSAIMSLRQAQIIGGIGGQTVLALAGPAPELDAETAETYTLGFDFLPSDSSDLTFNLTYFNIDYQDRIASPSTIAARGNPVAWPEVIYQPTVLADVIPFLLYPFSSNNTGISLTDPATAAAALLARSPDFWIVDGRTRNLAVSRLDGFDLAVSDEFDLPWGQMVVGAQVTRIFSYKQQVSPSSPILSATDDVLLPADLRGRLWASHSSEHLTTTISVNYVDDYRDTRNLTGPVPVDSWLTVDWNTTFEFPGTETRLNLSIQNLLDEDPPAVGRSQGLAFSSGFDPANANPLGRFVVLSIVHSW